MVQCFNANMSVWVKEGKCGVLIKSVEPFFFFVELIGKLATIVEWCPRLSFSNKHFAFCQEGQLAHLSSLRAMIPHPTIFTRYRVAVISNEREQQSITSYMHEDGRRSECLN